MNFKNIDKKYRPVPFWSWNEKLNVPETLRQVGLMDDVGIGGFFMHARGGLQTEYMGEEWFENVTACVDEAEKRGFTGHTGEQSLSFCALGEWMGSGRLPVTDGVG